MKKVIAPIQYGDQGEEVANLQRALEALGFPIEAEQEKQEQRYGSGTASAVGTFKSRYELGDLEPDRFDQEAADMINRLLTEQGLLDEEEAFTVSGQVARPDGTGVGGLVVRAYDKCLGVEKQLSEGITNAVGDYVLAYQAEHLINPARKRADLLVRVFSSAGGLEIESPLIINALSKEVINLVVGEEPYRGRDLYNQLHQRLAGFLEDVALDEIEAQDLYCLANKTNIPVDQIHHYVRARQWEAEWEDLPGEVAFAWFRVGLPTQWGDLLGRSAEELQAGLEQAVEENVVSPDTLAHGERLEESLLAWRSVHVLTPDGRPVTRASLGSLLEATALSEAQRRNLVHQWQTFKGDAAGFWDRQREQLGESTFDDLELTLELGALTRNHLPLIDALKTRAEVRRFADIARFSEDDWLHLFEEAGLEMPSDIRGEDVPAQRRAYAGALIRFTEQLLPTRVLAESFARDADIDSGLLAPFFERNRDFEFRNQSVRHYLEEHPDALDGLSDPEAAKKDLEALQRVFHLSPATNRTAAARVLWQNGMHSAWAILLRGEDALISAFGGDTEMALRVHQKATLAHQTSNALVMQYMDSMYSPGHVMPQGTDAETPQAEGLADLGSLFGGQGYCECKHCRSFFSPSAYLVDLFLYLKRAKLAPGHADGSVDTVLEKLFERRPDLANIELDCENSHTPLPYIDLVNEVLENAIDPREYDQKNVTIVGKTFTLPFAKETAGPEAVPQTEADPATLKALPQHLNPGAYQILMAGEQNQGASYPWNLPFNLWAAEVRTYLEHLKVPRWQLMESILGQLVDETAIAAEYLGLIPEERGILGDDPDTATLAAYWGIAGPLTELEAIETFLRQSAFSYNELRQLLDLRYVQTANPDQAIAIVFDPPSSCQVADASLENLNIEALSRIHRLGRLQRKLDEEWVPLDQTVMALGGEINDAFLQDLADLKRIEKSLPRRIKRADILSWWSLLATHDYPQQDSLYTALFLNPGISQPVEEELVLNEERNELEKADQGQATVLDLTSPAVDPDLQATILAGLQWTTSELTAAATDAWGGPGLTLNLANLSYLYRISSFCRALRMKVLDYLALKALVGTSPLPGPADPAGAVRPSDTLAFIRKVQLIRDVGLDPEMLNYLLRHQARAEAPFALGTDEIEQILMDLQAQVIKLLNEADPKGIPIHEKLQIKLSRLLLPEDVTTTLQIVSVDPALSLSVQEQKAFLDETLRFFPDPDDAKAQLIDGGLSDPDERYAYVLEDLEPYLVEQAVVQRLAEAVGMDTKLADALLRSHLPHPSDPALAAVRTFFAAEFLNPTEGASFSEIDFPDQAGTVLRLQKIRLVIDGLELDADAVGFIMEHGVGAGLPDLSQIPFAANPAPLPAGAFNAWHRSMAVVHISREHFRNGIPVFDVLAYPLDSSHTEPGMLELLSEATSWNLSDLMYVTGASGLNLTYPDDYLSGDWVVKLAETMPLVARVGASAQQMAEWTNPEVSQAQADSVRHAVKAKYGNDQWLEVTTPLRNRIREQQRDALLGFVLHHRQKHDQTPFEGADDLYAYYLIDPQMSACAMTSRTVLATSSVQLFVQRIMLNLEPGMTLTRKHADEWKWRKQYRIWEANRKVLLWPENWYEPELRDDKSPFFKEMENELMQGELNDETIERAYVNYLYRLNEVARLQICGVHYEEAAKTLHVFGRTAGVPSAYYYRRWENRREWTPWEKVELDIHNAEGVEEPQTGVLLLPVVHNRRLFLFWPIFTLKRDGPDDDAKKEIEIIEYAKSLVEKGIRDLENQGGTAAEIANAKAGLRAIEDDLNELKAGKQFFSMKMAYTHYRQSHWAPRSCTQEALRTPYFENVFEGGKYIHLYFFKPETDQNGSLRITWYYSQKNTYYKLKSYFTFDSCRSELRAGGQDGANQMGEKLPDWMWFMKAMDDGESPYPLRVINWAGDVDVLLNSAGRRHLLSVSLDRGVIKQTTPFFYEDSRRTFFVIPPDPWRFAEKLGEVLGMAALDGKGMSFGQSADERAVVADPEPQAVAERAEFIGGIGTEAISNRFFQAEESELVIVRSSDTAALPMRRQDLLPAGGGPGYALSEASRGFSNVNVVLFQEGDYIFRTFYHPHVCLFLKQLNRFGLDGLLDPDPAKGDGKELSRQLTPDHLEAFDFNDEYDPNGNEVRWLSDYPQDIITFDYKDAYAGYNWEVFFDAPLLIATRLFQDQRFEEAQRWFHYIFDPTETDGDAPYRFWKIKPFHSYTLEQMEADMKALLQGKTTDQITAWQNDPFNPSLLARFRPLARMKTTVMKYLDNLIAWGDQLFRRDSIESINEATQLYVLAGQILGKLPVQTEAKESEPKTFSDLAEQLDALGNAWVEIELNQQGGDTEAEEVSPTGTPEILVPYFCFPPNEKLLSYWDVVADRLFKIRHCMNIEGLVRQLPLFQPPIEPGLLVRAAAAGVDLSSAVSDLFAPLPHYRFPVMVQKAQEICQELKSLGGALLSALEKKDTEALARMRARQETALLEANREIRTRQIEEAEHHLASLKEGLELANIRYENYRDRDFISPAEGAAIGLSIGATVAQAVSGVLAANAGGAKLFPDSYIGVHAQYLASGTSTLTHIAGGEKTGSGLDSAAKAMDVVALILREAGNITSTFAQYERRQEDWDLQRDLAQQERTQIEKQILAAQVRIAIAEKEQTNLNLQITHAQTVADFMKDKYTQQQLYGWMVGQITSVYFQTYQLAYDIAKQAEKTFRHELGIDQSDYIRFGYWDNLKKGLLAGERLSLDLKRLEMAYFEQNRREYELTKHVSLRQLNPQALLALKATGVCEITLPEWLFDLDCPGHYMRRIKNVSLSIPAVTGPYTSVNCTLSLQNSTVRRSPLLKDDQYARDTDEEDSRFVDYYGIIQSIVTSNAQDDSGMFETNLRDERYLPFEGHGADSSWRLELPSRFRQFDYDTISDVILHVRYTARQGGGPLRQAAVDHIQQLIQDAGTSGLVQLFSLRHEFPSDWYRFVSGEGDFKATVKKAFFPYFVHDKNISIHKADVYAIQGDELNAASIADPALLADYSDGLNGDDAEFTVTLAEGPVLERDTNARVFVALAYSIS